jgi:hypothetical protein
MVISFKPLIRKRVAYPAALLRGSFIRSVGRLKKYGKDSNRVDTIEA